MTSGRIPDAWPPDEETAGREDVAGRDDRPPDYGLRHVEIYGRSYCVTLVNGRVWATGGVLRGRVEVDALVDLALALGAAGDELRGLEDEDDDVGGPFPVGGPA